MEDIRTKPTTPEYREGWDRAFKPRVPDCINVIRHEPDGSVVVKPPYDYGLEVVVTKEMVEDYNAIGWPVMFFKRGK